MKKSILILLLVISSVISAQTVKTFIHYDELEEVYYCLPTRNLIVANEKKTIGFTIQPTITYKTFTVDGLIIQSAGLSDCNENSVLIILLTNSEKLVLYSWNEFNCQATSYFTITPEQAATLKTAPIKMIRFTNGSSKDAYTGTIPITDSNYFIDLFNSLKNQKK